MTTPRPELDGVWLFDGHCNFCSGSVRVALHFDRRRALRFVPLQSPFGLEIARRYGLDVENPESFLFFERGQPLAASDAVLALARQAGFPLSILAALRIIPRRARDRAYGLLARNRYRLMGRRETCMVPTPDQCARFLLEPPSGWS